MAVFKCKSCGAPLQVAEGMTVVECAYCDVRQTVPSSRSDEAQNIFNRATNLRLECEFDKALQVYEKILEAKDSDAEAHWGVVLCKYGIEYVNDPKTGKRVPTCHRTLYESILSDPDYLAAVKYADATQKPIYEQEAETINNIQKSILNIVKNEKPFDVFISYKEADNGVRTLDSAIANDIYYQLTNEGFKVFYAPITLNERVVGEYEPYIFAAINSAKIMLVLGTKLEYFEAVWVKNEWSRFLKLTKTDHSKRLMPCYRDMDAYELPIEFSLLQKYDMGKISFIVDLVNGIKKELAPKDEPKTYGDAPAQSVAPLLKRAQIFLEDKNWHSADEYCEKVLDIEPENPEAYLYKLMAELRVTKRESLAELDVPYGENPNYIKAVRYADNTLADELKEYLEKTVKREKYNIEEAKYIAAVEKMNNSVDEEQFLEAASAFDLVPDFKDSAELKNKCRERAEEARKTAIYNAGLELYNHTYHVEIRKSAELFKQIPGFKDADELLASVEEKAETVRKDAFVKNCRLGLNDHDIENMNRAIEGLRAMNGWRGADELADQLEKHKADVIEEERRKKQAEEEEIARKKQSMREYAERCVAARRKERAKLIITRTAIGVLIAAVVTTVTLLIYNYGFKIPGEKYATAVAFMEDGDYESAIELFTELGRRKNSDEMVLECKYLWAGELAEEDKLAEACDLYAELAKQYYSDSADKRAEIIKVNHSLAEVGDVIVLGSYEQDNDKENGKEPIEWVVFAKDDDGLIVASKYLLDFKPYCEGSDGYHKNWSESTLRKWLNGTFYKAAFSAEEQERVIAFERETSHKQIKGSDILSDKVFLLSSDDSEYELIEKEQITYTAYAKSIWDSSRHYTGDDTDPKYWLRTPTGGAGADMYANSGYSTRWTYDSGFVRPAIRVSLEK